jgi:hypothetical protein
MANSSDGRSKVARLIEEYELGGIGEEFERRWTREENRSSLRDLADEFNRRLLRAALERTGDAPLDGEVDNLYRLLTRDDVTSGVRQQARNRVEENDIDIAALEDDFVSYQAVRTYLKRYRDASPPDTTATPDEQIRKKRSTIQRLTTRLASVTEQSLRELASSPTLTLGDFDVIVTVRVHCSSCETQLPVTELLTERGCNCD